MRRGSQDHVIERDWRLEKMKGFPEEWCDDH